MSSSSSSHTHFETGTVSAASSSSSGASESASVKATSLMTDGASLSKTTGKLSIIRKKKRNCFYIFKPKFLPVSIANPHSGT